MTKNILLLPLAGLFCACGSFAPTEGTWTMGDFEVSEDTCNLDSGEETEESEPTTFALTLTDGGFTIKGDGDGAETVSCTLENQDFTCDSLSSNLMEEETITLTLTTSYSGSFVSAGEFNADIENTLSCEGSDCETFSTQSGIDVPCNVNGSSNATVNE